MRVVGLGASAGGMEALIELLSQLPDNTSAAYVLILHLSPDHQSIMDELLAKHANMPISIVNTITPVQANHIYIIPNDKNLTLNNNMLVTHPRAPADGLNLPIDLFFHSLGESQQEKAIGVILSGTGTDGSRGVRTIKEAGGLVLVQSPESAKFDGMPKSVIRLQIADKILPPIELARMLTDIMARSNQGLNPEAVLIGNVKDSKSYLNRILQEVHISTGIDFSGYREATLNRRLSNRVLLHRLNDPEKYFEVLRKDDQEVFALQKDFLIGVTRFFRDRLAFEALENIVLPQIFENRDNDNLVRIWVPACSTGEEAYSIALVLARYLEKNKLKHDFKIFGTDIDNTAIALASEGVFPDNCAVDIPSELLLEYFTKESDFYRIKGSIRDKMLFAVHNLLNDPPFIHMDLISCRNALIYFKPPYQHTILSTFHFALNPTSFLFLGPSESLGQLKHAYTQIDKKWNFYQKKEKTQLPYKSRLRPGPAYLKQSTGEVSKASSSSRPAAPVNKDPLEDPFTQYLIDYYVPTVLFLAENLDILYIQGEIDELFSFPKGNARFNLMNMLPSEQIMIFEDGIDKIKNSDKLVLYKGVSFGKNGKEHKMDLRFRRVTLPVEQQWGFMVELLEEMEEEGSIPKQEEVLEDERLKDHIGILEGKLSKANRNSADLVDKLGSTNDELQVSNRELMAANEELQSTNEELQSVNEELHTVNNELQIKNENLITANNDINNLLKSTEIGTIFLDAELKIRRFTPAIRGQFNLLETDIGRPITHFSSTLKKIDIAEICRRVFETQENFEQEVTDHQGNHYLLRILPYRTEKKLIKGLVINFVDVNELMRVKEQIETFANKFQAIFQYSNEIIMVLEIDGRIKRINKDFGDYQIEELLNQSVFELLSEEKAEKLGRVVQKTYENKEPQEIEIELPLKSGEKNFFNGCVIPVFDPDDQEAEVQNIIVMWQDLTGQIKAHDQMVRAIYEYESSMGHAGPQIILADRDGIIKYIKLPGLEQYHLLGRRIYDFGDEDQARQISKAIKQVFTGMASEKIEYEMQLDDKKRIMIELVGTPVVINDTVKYAALIVSEK